LHEDCIIKKARIKNMYFTMLEFILIYITTNLLKSRCFFYYFFV